MMFAGQRPILFALSVASLACRSLSATASGLFFQGRSNPSLVPPKTAAPLMYAILSPEGATRQASMFMPPVPYLRTFLYSGPSNGLLATTIGSRAGLRAVPQPSHRLASSVVSTPERLLISLEIFMDLGKPIEYNQSIESRISNPASSMAHVIRW